MNWPISIISMKVTQQIARHLREIHHGKNWTWSWMNTHLKDKTWEQATTQIHDMNTIATLVNHMHFYVQNVIRVLEGGKLEGTDKDSFEYPPIKNQHDWENMLNRTWNDAERLAVLIEQMPEEQLWDNIAEEKYGNFYRNLHGIIEHNHYHLGQIVLIKKLLQQSWNRLVIKDLCSKLEEVQARNPLKWNLK